ncbi:hypothetical protein PG990_003653 [Apiospora arundinis]
MSSAFFKHHSQLWIQRTLKLKTANIATNLKLQLRIRSERLRSTPEVPNDGVGKPQLARRTASKDMHRMQASQDLTETLCQLKCDSKAKYPNPCSRCQSRHLRCTVDPMFKRTPARKRLEAMSKELQELRQKQGAEGSTRLALLSTEPSTSRDNSHTPNPSSSEAGGDDFEFDLEEVQLDGVVLKRELAIDAFKIFATYYHPQLPILGPISMPNIFQTCPLLFWTIIGIVSFRMSGPPYQELFQRLKQPFYNYLNREALIAPLPLRKIQAILCVCHWTLGAGIQMRDPSWLYSGIAMNASFYMRPGYVRNAEETSEDIDTRVNTWLGCFYVCNSLAMHLGLTPLISQPSELRTIKSLFSDYHGPQEFLTQVKVQQLIAGFAGILWPNTNGLLIDVSLVQTIDEKLDEISDEQKAGLGPDDTDMADFTDFTILTTKLHMYAAIVTRAPSGSTSRSILLKMGLGAALRIIDLAQSIMPRPAAATAAAGASSEERSDHENKNSTQQLELSREDRQRALSKKHSLGILFAAVFLLRYFSLNSAAPADERQRAANHVLEAHCLFRSWSLGPRDEYARAAVLLETLCRQAPAAARADADGSQQQKPRATDDRMGVSILFEAIDAAKELGNGRVTAVEEQTARPTGGLRGAGATSTEHTSSRVVEKGKQVTAMEEEENPATHSEAAAVSAVDMPSFYFDGGMGSMTGGQGGYEEGLPPHFWDNPMWDVFNFDFEAAASGQRLDDPFL